MKKKSSLFILLIALGVLACQQAHAVDVTISVRYQDNLLYTDSVSLPGAGTVVLSDVDGIPHTINAQSVLSVLSLVDGVSSSFDISQLQYFSSFGSLYLKCITVSASSLQACDNWQYVINDTAPFVGMDSYVLSGGETIYIYFGNSHQVVLNSSSIALGGLLIATAQQYQYQDNTWTALSGVTLGVRKGNDVLMTQSVDSQGVGQFTLNTSPGNYTIGIADDFYFPSFELSVYASGGPARVQQVQQKKETPEFDVDRAIQFLTNNQLADGSFGSSLLSDWATVALGASEGEMEAKERLRQYLILHSNPGTSLTDYERRAMALMALDINPYSGTPVNYIEKITSSFNGSQFGDVVLLNDDVFALLVLLRAGFSPSDEMIQRSLLYLFSHQQADGSFAGSVDMTAAAVQVFALLPGEGAVGKAIESATSFLNNNQNLDGGFGNVFSTSWAMQAIEVVGSQKFPWQRGENTPMSALALLQREDGGIEDVSLENRIWATSYAIPAAEKKPWPTILQSFSKEELFVPQSTRSLPHNRILLLKAELDGILEETQHIQTQLTALKEVSQQFVREQEQPFQGIYDLTLRTETKQQQDIFTQLGAGVVLVKDSLDAPTAGLAVVGLALALLLTGGMPVSSFMKLARIIMQKRSS